MSDPTEDLDASDASDESAASEQRDDVPPWDPVRDVEQAAAFDQGTGAAITAAAVTGLALVAAAGIRRLLRRRR